MSFNELILLVDAKKLKKDDDMWPVTITGRKLSRPEIETMAFIERQTNYTPTTTLLKELVAY